MQVVFNALAFGQARSAFLCRRAREVLLIGLVSLYGVGHACADSPVELPARLIGATATIIEVSSGLPFAARIDTGATTCSIHYEEIEIKDAHEDPKENIGKPIRILVKNDEGKTEWVKSKIADYVTVRTSKVDDERYSVPLKLQWEDVEKKVLVTLNNRERMKYPLLIGRNFLRGDFIVHVDLDGDD